MLEFGNINNTSCVFLSSIGDVLPYLEGLTKSGVAEVPISLVDKRNRYYISSDCRVFFAKPISDRYSVTERKKEKAGCQRIRLAVGHGKEKVFPLSQLVYNAFVLKAWSDNIPLHLDGNPSNCAISNLVEKADIVKPVEIRDSQLSSYMTRFGKIRDLLVWLYAIKREDAEDIAASAYYEVYANNEHSSEYATNLWLVTAKHDAIDFLRHRYSCRMLDFDEKLHFVRESAFDHYGEKIDIVSLVSGDRQKMYFTYYLQGYTPTEIGKMCNTTRSNVASVLTKQVQAIRKRLAIK